LGALAIALTKFKSSLLALFSGGLKLGWLLKGLWTMFLSLWLYVVVFGWKFAIVMMLMLLAHEGGHWIFMKAYGLEPKAPVFIPFIGAYVAMSKMPKDVYTHAWVAYAGPLIGGLFAVAVYILGSLTDTVWLMAGGAFGCMLNLLQLIPAWIFDGKFIIQAISKWLLIPGTLVLIVVAFIWQSPFLFIIAIASIVSLFKQFKQRPVTDESLLLAQGKTMRELEIELTKDKSDPFYNNETNQKEGSAFWQRCQVSIAYLSLVATLAAAYSIENSRIAQKMPQFGAAQSKNPAMAMLIGGGLSKTVPEGKTAAEYYILGFQYKAAGWTEQAREALTKAIKIDGDGTISQKAKNFIKTRLPRYPVPEKALSMNITANAENSLFTRNKAEEIWKQCITEYPKFEWSYSNLRDLYVQEGRYKEAEQLLSNAISINPNYVNAWWHLAECKLKQNDEVNAKNCVNKALELDPDDLGAKLIKLRIRIYELFHIS